MQKSRHEKRRDWNERWKNKNLIKGGVVPSMSSFDTSKEMTKVVRTGVSKGRNVSGFLGSSELDPNFKTSYSYEKVPYTYQSNIAKPYYLGADSSTSSDTNTATISMSAIFKLALVGVISALATEMIRRSIWGKR